MAEGDAQQDMGFMYHLEELRRRLFFALLGILTAAIGLFIAKDWVFFRLIFGPRHPDFITFRAWCALGHLTGAGDRLCVTEISYELINTTMLGNFSSVGCSCSSSVSSGTGSGFHIGSRSDVPFFSASSTFRL